MDRGPPRGALRGLSLFCPKSTKVDLVSAYRGMTFGAGKWSLFLSQFQQTLKLKG
jgi:hypothetical protein